MPSSALRLVVAALRQPNDVVRVVELRAEDGGELPAFTPGAHLELTLAPGLLRSYSLVNDAAERDRYVLGVGLDAASRGGSRHIHESLRVGHVVESAPPRNRFELVEGAPHSVLIAGGIGITPLLCMARRLHALGRSWELHFVARTSRHAGFLDELATLGGGVHLYFDRAPGGAPLPLETLVRGAAPASHLYACGPAGLLDAFERLAADRDPGTVHLERFSGTAPVGGGGFDLVLARSNRTLRVADGQTILQALTDAGFSPNFSCAEGVCGTCETRVLEGRPDHRDQVLTRREREAGQVMMICCSRSLDPRLALDL